jgi:hypothetical protein
MLYLHDKHYLLNVSSKMTILQTPQSIHVLGKSVVILGASPPPHFEGEVWGYPFFSWEEENRELHVSQFKT